MAVKTKEIDLGYNRILKEIDKLKKKPYAKIGLLANLGKHDNSDLTVVQIGAIHEFGSEDGKTPERSYLRSTHDEKIKEWHKLAKKLQAKIYLGKISVEDALRIMGEQGVIDVKNKIRKGPFIPLAQVTIDRKGSDKPLIDTAQMINSINHQEILNGKNKRNRQVRHG